MSSSRWRTWVENFWWEAPSPRQGEFQSRGGGGGGRRNTNIVQVRIVVPCFREHILNIIKHPFRRGVNFNYVWIIFSSHHHLETSFDVLKVKHVCLYFCRQLPVFSKCLRQGLLFKAENWHVLAHEQYFLKHRFSNTCRLVDISFVNWVYLVHHYVWLSFHQINK